MTSLLVGSTPDPLLGHAYLRSLAYLLCCIHLTSHTRVSVCSVDSCLHSIQSLHSNSEVPTHIHTAYGLPLSSPSPFSPPPTHHGSHACMHASPARLLPITPPTRTHMPPAAHHNYQVRAHAACCPSHLPHARTCRLLPITPTTCTHMPPAAHHTYHMHEHAACCPSHLPRARTCCLLPP